MYGYSECPRCGGWSLEHLKTHCHCWECGYFPEEDPGLTSWRNLEYRNSKIASQRRAEDARLMGGGAQPDGGRLTDDQIDDYYKESLARAKGVL